MYVLHFIPCALTEAHAARDMCESQMCNFVSNHIRFHISVYTHICTCMFTSMHYYFECLCCLPKCSIQIYVDSYSWVAFIAFVIGLKVQHAFGGQQGTREDISGQRERGRQVQEMKRRKLDDTGPRPVRRGCFHAMFERRV